MKHAKEMAKFHVARVSSNLLYFIQSLHITGKQCLTQPKWQRRFSSQQNTEFKIFLEKSTLRITEMGVSKR